MEHGASRSGGEELLANLGWVRRLALAIVRDSSAADDVTQEVARVALERGEPVPASGLRAWLGAVTRRLALDRTRSDAARRARERSVARPEGDGSEAEIVERSARQQRVARAVMDLAEPYRSTILYRYLDEMPMAEVARRTNVNEVTARKRLSRGLEMLRARLDTEFGTSTRSWAITLLAPGKVTLIMSTKWIAAGAAAVIVGLGWWGWHVAHSPASSTEAPAIAADSHLEQPPIETKDAPASAPIAPETAALTDSKRVSATLPPPDSDATILHVRVLDRVGSAATEGRIECWWSVARIGFTDLSRKFVDANMNGEVTDITLPPSAVTAAVRASVHGHLGTNWLEVRRLRQGATGIVERDVSLSLDEPLDAPALHGRVTVDGQPRVPRAFEFVQAKEGQSQGSARVNAVDATYALPKVSVGSALKLTSDETVPLSITVTEEMAASGALDVELSTGKTLTLTLLDRDSGRPLADTDFMLENHSYPLVGDRVSDTRMHTTDSNGVCVTRGLSQGAYVVVRPGIEPRTRPMIFSDDWGEQNLGKFTPTSDMPVYILPWWTHRVNESEPSIEVTLRVKPVSDGATIFGSVPKEMLEGQADVSTRVRVAAQETNAEHAKENNPFDVPIDAEGQWSLPVHWPSTYAVWMERVKTRAILSMESDVDVPTAGRHGPVEFHPLAPAAQFELIFENVPPDGLLSVSLRGENVPSRNETVDCKSARCTHSLRIEGPCKLDVTWSGHGDEPGTSEIRRSFEVDPKRERSKVVDLYGNQMRTILLQIDGAALPPHALLGFSRLDSQSRLRVDATSTTVVDGKVQGKVALAPGRWLFDCFDQAFTCYVAGVIDVAAGQDALTIHREIVALSRDQAPRGVEFTELDGVRLDSLERPIRLPWTSAKGSIVFNSTARYTPLP